MPAPAAVQMWQRGEKGERLLSLKLGAVGTDRVDKSQHERAQLGYSLVALSCGDTF